MEKSMKYVLKLWHSSAYVMRNEFIHGHSSGCVQASLAIHKNAHIASSSLKELAALLEDEPRLLKILNSHRGTKEHGGHNTQWVIGPNRVTLPRKCNITDAIAKLRSLHVRIEPLLELGEIMCKQLDRRPLKTDVALNISGHREIDGLSPEQWLAKREEVGTKIDPNTAEVIASNEQALDPYGVHGDPPGCYQGFTPEWFVRAPGSDVWVWNGDLPKATQQALFKRLTKEKREAKNEEALFEI
jgi:hypothetical protein